MHATTVAVDLAKSVFQLAITQGDSRLIQSLRLSRPQFERWFDNRAVDRVVMEACGSAHYWARSLRERGIEVLLLPPRYVRPYVKRNKTDAADAAALLEAARCADIVPVQVKSLEQQCMQSLHRMRSQWLATRTARINGMRGCCREFGISLSEGARVGLEQIGRLLADAHSALPALVRPMLQAALEEVRLLEQRIAELEQQLSTAAAQSPACQQLLSIPGVGLMTATAMTAATGGSVSHFKDARHFASWFGLTPKEHSSGGNRHLGRISKRGDRYLRMLLTHGARSLLRAATVSLRCQRPLDPLRTWAVAVQARTHRNKAVCALANKLARICYATLRDRESYHGIQTARKLRRTSYALAH